MPDLAAAVGEKDWLPISLSLDKIVGLCGVCGRHDLFPAVVFTLAWNGEMRIPLRDQAPAVAPEQASLVGFRVSALSTERRI